MSWTQALDEQSTRQGWIISCTGGADGHPPYELERIDFPEDGSDAVFLGDRQAHEFVRERALAGDSLAVSALAFLATHSPEEYDTVVNSKHEGWP